MGAIGLLGGLINRMHHSNLLCLLTITMVLSADLSTTEHQKDLGFFKKPCYGARTMSFKEKHPSAFLFLKALPYTLMGTFLSAVIGFIFANIIDFFNRKDLLWLERVKIFFFSTVWLVEWFFFSILFFGAGFFLASIVSSLLAKKKPNRVVLNAGAYIGVVVFCAALSVVVYTLLIQQESLQLMWHRLLESWMVAVAAFLQGLWILFDLKRRQKIEPSMGVARIFKE